MYRSGFFATVLAGIIYLIPFISTEAAFTRYEQNPILSPNHAYEINGVFAPTVLYAKNQYYMWYSSHDGSKWTISLATSPDGLTWTKYENNPIILPDSSNPHICERNVHDPDVIWDDSLQKFQMWFVANCEPQSTGVPRYWIKYAYSTDGINWTTQQDPVIKPALSWEIEGVGQPAVIVTNQMYKLWYSGRDSSGRWSIGYAESENGNLWNKNISPILIPSDGSEIYNVGGGTVIFRDHKYNFFYHSNFTHQVIKYALSNEGDSWVSPADEIVLDQSDTEYYLESPKAIAVPNNIFIYYTTIINDKWHISLATEETPQPPKKIILLPGLFGSWNKEAILHNQTVGLLDWKPNPIVKEYDGMIQTLKNLGYVENEDFFIFAYDWRRKLDALADDLNDFVSQKITDPGVKVNLVGHSLGGLVARIFAQKYGTDKIDKLLTIGSPHQGTAQAYKTVEAGEIDEVNTIQNLAEKLILVLNKDDFETDRETIEKKFPVAKDLLPTFDFLKKQNGQFIPISQMKIKNETLLSYGPTFGDIFPIFQSHLGEKGDTLFGYKIRSRTILDKLLGNYPDGRPKESLFEIGDFIVPSSSAKADSDFKILPADHGEIIYKKESLAEILDSLGISYQENQITEGEATQIWPALIFLILSSGEIEVEFDGQAYQEKDGLIFIENAQDGDYLLKVKGKEKGNYTIIIGQLTEEKDILTKLEGKITEEPPDSQTDNYAITFDVDSPLDYPINQNDTVSLFDLLINELKYINEDVNNGNLNKSIDELKKAKQNYLKSRLQLTKARLLSVHHKIFSARRNLDNAINKKIIHSLEKLENLYHRSLENLSPKPTKNILKRELFTTEKLILVVERLLLFQQLRGRDVTGKAAKILLINQKIDKAEKALDQDNLHLAQILLVSIKRLLTEAIH